MNNILNPEPPDGTPPENQGPDGKFTWKDFLGLGLIGGAVTQQLKDFIDSFKNKFGEVQEGENNFGGEIPIIQEYNSSFYINNIPKETGIFINGDKVLNISFEKLSQTPPYEQRLTVVMPNGEVISNTVVFPGYPPTYTIYWNYFGKNDLIVADGAGLSVTWKIPDKYENINTFNPLGVTYYITNNSPVLDPVQNPPPEKIYIPYLPDIDPTNDKLKQVMLPSGEQQLIYEGTEDDYLDDVVEHVTFTQLQTGVIPGVIITPVQNPDPNGEPYIILEPEQQPLPFPDIQPVPDVDLPGGFPNLIGYLQMIINWISNVFNSIISIPFQIIEGIKGLFIPQENYLALKTEILTTTINTKLGNPSATPLQTIFNFECVPIPDGIYQGHVIFDASFINNQAEKVRDWQRFFWWILIFLVNLNNFYKLIRGHDLINTRGEPTTGGGGGLMKI